MGTSRRIRNWWQAKHPVLRFVVLLVVFLGLWEWILNTSFAQRVAFEPHLRAYASALGAALGLLGHEVTVQRNLVSSSTPPPFAVSIVEGCDAIQPVGLFVAAVLASPVAWRPKIPGLIIGSLFLMGMNLLRILILFHVGRRVSHETFEMAHRDISQGAFIVLVVLTFVVWAFWALKRQRIATHAASTSK